MKGEYAMKRFISVVVALILLCAVSCAYSEYAENAQGTWEPLMDITVRINERGFDAVLYDNPAGSFVAEQLPYAVHLDKGEIDYCGTTDLEFEDKGFDSRDGYEKGELLYYRGWFVIFLNEKLPAGESGEYIPFGRLSDSDAVEDLLKNGESSVDVVIESRLDEVDEMKMMIGSVPVRVDWESNESVAALRALTAEKPLTIKMSMYGGFEQVGPIGQALPRNDVQTVTGSGDIVLYSGNQIVVFYGSNSWAYTRLGHITDKSAQEMAELLGKGDVTITIGR